MIPKLAEDGFTDRSKHGAGDVVQLTGHLSTDGSCLRVGDEAFDLAWKAF